MGKVSEPPEGDGDPISERLDDLQVYKALLALVEEVEWLSRRCWSVKASTSLQVAAQLIRKVASAVYNASLRP